MSVCNSTTVFLLKAGDIQNEQLNKIYYCLEINMHRKRIRFSIYTAMDYRVIVWREGGAQNKLEG